MAARFNLIGASSITGVSLSGLNCKQCVTEAILCSIKYPCTAVYKLAVHYRVRCSAATADAAAADSVTVLCVLNTVTTGNTHGASGAAAD
jgi:hypothetical protein